MAPTAGSYSGVSSDPPTQANRGIAFIPRYGGMNLETVQDGSLQPDEAFFGARHSPISPWVDRRRHG